MDDTTATRAPHHNRHRDHQGKGRKPLRVASPRQRVSLAGVTLGIVLIVGCALASVLLYERADQRRPVLAIARPVQVGQALADLDLTTVSIPADSGLESVDAAEQASVIGRPAATTLLPGQLLVDQALGQAVGLAPEVAVAGVALEAGRYPPGISAGAQVRVLDTGVDNEGGGQQAAAGGVLVGQATVVDVRTPPAETGGVQVVTLQLPLGASAPVVAAAAGGRLALVLVSAEAS